MQVKALSWNLFHGRDFPPDPALRTWRSRLLRTTERNETHVQANRELLPEFSEVLAAAEWDVAMLQECPPRWWDALAAACGAEAHGALTSRNSLAPLRSLAARLNPDLIASGEGGSNLTLVRGSLCTHMGQKGPGDAERGGSIGERRELTIHAGRPERRAMAFSRVALSDRRGDAEGGGGGRNALCIANLHATNDRPALAGEDVLRAAQAATEWAGDAPLIFGGDLNLRPAHDPAVFEQLRDRFGLAGPTAPDAIDHLLVRGLDVVTPPRLWPAARREVVDRRERAGGEAPARREGRGSRGSPRDDRAIRLSDHAPVEGCFATPAARG